MNRFKHFTFWFLTLILGFQTLSAQTKNIFYERSYWKSNPSLEDIKSKIKEGNSPTQLTEFGFDATVYAILEKVPVSTVEFLINQGNDVNKITHDARTYLFWAAYAGDVETMRYLYKQGAKTDLLDQHGYSVIMFAAATGQANTKVYDYCIELGADLKKEKTKDGKNALLAYAGSMKDLSGIEYFVKKGLDINVKDKDGNGVFHYAAKTGNQEILEKLIKKYKIDYSKNAQTNENAILFATRRFSRTGEENSLAFYQYLEGLELDPAIVSKSGNTALINLAYQAKDTDVINYFINKGVNVNQIDEDGNNALIQASYGNSLELVNLYLNKTKNINHSNKDGETAFSAAIKYNDLEVAKALAKAGAETTVAGKDLGFEIITSSRGKVRGFEEKFAYLKEVGYNPVAARSNGATLLHAAVKKQDKELIAYLIDLGVDVNAKDTDGQTALHATAMQSENDELLKLLISSGADKSLLTAFDESAYDLATQNELLSKNGVNVEFLKP